MRILKIFTFTVTVLLFSLLLSKNAEATTASGYCMEEEEMKFIALINDYRKSNNLVPLKVTKTLSASAEHHSVDMSRLNLVAHDLPGLPTWSQNITNHGYPTGTSRGQNAAGGYKTAADVFAGWKSSPGHNGNMLNTAWTAIGIGRVYNSSTSTFMWFWTTDFGSAVDTTAPPLCSGVPTPTNPPPTPTPVPVNYVRLPYSLSELSSGTTVNQWKGTLIYIKKNMNLNQIGFYNTGASAKYEVRNSESGGSIGTLVSSGNFKSTANSSGYYYQDTNINLSSGRYYLIRVYPTTGRYYYGSTSTYYSELSFLRRGNGTSKAATTGAFQLRLRFTLR